MAKNVILTLLAMLSPVICLATSLNSYIDEYALLAFKSRINYDPNEILVHNWSQGTPFCNWIGITCDRAHQRVIGLNLANMSLGGTIAKEIGKLSFLNSLVISNNNFHGFIPYEMGNLSQLRQIEMQCNELNGSIPTSLGFLKNLQKINLSENSLAGHIPNMIFNLSSLVEVDFVNNSLSGTLPMDTCFNLPNLEKLRISSNVIGGHIPRSLGSCGKLKLLSMSINKFVGTIPKEIANLSELQILYLGENCLTGIIPDGMGNLSVLHRLDLRSNNLTSNIPPSFGKMSHLETFSIRANNIQGQIPPELGHLSNLKEIIFSFNKLEGEIPESIFNLSKLQLLALTENDISGTLPSSIAYGLPDLENLYLALNRISGDIPHYISNFSKLAKLDLGHNSFGGSVPMNLGNLQNLRYLSIEYNELTNDPSMQELDFLISLNNCKKLETIQIGYNYFDGMLPKSTGNMSTSLQIFYAPSCRIKGPIPSDIGNLSSLIWLEMGGNELTGKIPDTLSKLKKVQKLSLNDNKLGGSIPVNLCNLVHMYHLDLGNNKLSTHLPTCLGYLTSLQELNLSYNSLSSTIPSTLWTNREIQIMDLSYNLFFGTLALEIGNAKGIRELYLSGNQFSGEIPITVEKLQSLVILKLSNNQLYGPIPESFSNLIAMQILDLSKNNLYGVIPKSMEKLRNLVYFNVSFNELSGEIPNGGPFKNLTAYSFMGNDELCGAAQFKVIPCKVNTSKSSSKTRFLKYILPPSALAASLVIIMVWLLSRHNRNATLRDQSSFPIPIKRISYFEVLRSTNNFDAENLISRGSISSVYKGIFSDGMIAAIKVFNLDMEGTNKSFDTECNLLCNIRHRNVVKVISSCSNLDLKALVLEYMPKGNLNSWLYSYDYCLNMAERLEIMINVASGLEYLHRGYPSPIVHCDLKPSNILLDEDMVAHVGDFGISKLFTQDQRISQTNTLGTIGYMAPEYGSMGIISTTADVYSYGIVLMETFTTKKPTDDIFVGELTMRRWVFELYQNAIMQIMDVDLLDGVEENIEAKEICFKSIVRLALECTTNLPGERLNIEDVLIRLKKIKIEFLSNIIGEHSITN